MMKGLLTKCARAVTTTIACGAVLALLSACGGGGGSGGGFLPGDGNGDLASYSLSLSIVDSAGNPTSQVSETFPATLLVEVREDVFGGEPVAGVVVSAVADFATISPENGQSLTDTQGIAEFRLSSGTALGADTITVTVESPAGQVTAAVGVEVGDSGLTLGFFDGTAFLPGQIGLSATNLAFRGSAELRLAVVDETGTSVTSIQQIRLSSACSLSGLASFRPAGDTGTGTSTLTIDTLDGLATAEYVAGSCENEDQLTATLIGGDSTALGSVTIADRDANFIGFVSAVPSEGEEGADRTIIALRGTGGPGRPEVATLVFEVLEEAVTLDPGAPQPGDPGYLEQEGRAPLAGIVVNFSLTNALGGITLSTDSGVTDSRGLVEVEVLSGNVATSTLVTATFDAQTPNGGNQPQSASSNQIVIGTGLPDQNSVSLSSEVFRVPRARDTDGVDVAITVRLADKFNNPVADGTSAVFTTEYGAIDSSCLTGVSNGARYQEVRDTTIPLRGTCTVLWVSQAPRLPVFNQDLVQTILDDNDYDCPSHTGSFGPCPDDLGAIRGLRSTVTVTVVGEEFFIDANGNGIYDQGETFENLPEAFTDHNEDGVYTPFAGPQCGLPSSAEECAAAGVQEEFIDFNGDGIYSLNVDPNTGQGVYNGSLCPTEGDGVFCTRELLNVRASLVLTLTSSDGNFSALVANTRNSPDVARDNISEGDLHVIHVADRFNNAPGAGTTISLETSGDCTLLTSESFTVPDTSAPGAFSFTASVEGDGGGGQLIVSSQGPDADSPSVVRPIPCVTTAPPDPNA